LLAELTGLLSELREIEKFNLSEAAAAESESYET
jgi:hypothetical protein